MDFIKGMVIATPLGILGWVAVWYLFKFLGA